MKQHFLPGALVGRLSLALACLFGVAWLAVPAAPAADFGDPGSRMRVYWLNSRLMVGVQPQPNEGYIQLARRVMAEPEQYRAIVALNREQPVRTGRPVVFPIATLKPTLWGRALRAMYPDDELTERGWAHTVTDPLESLIQLTEAYTGSRRRFRELARYNKLANPDVLRIGDEVVVPLHWIPEELGFRPVALAAPLRLERDDATGRLYAGYTVARNDTLYSLLLRFTDRERADELNRMAGLLMKLNGIRGEGGLLAGRTLRMPIEWIVAERRVGGAAPVKRLEPPAPPPPKRMLPSALTPIHVIVDAGHGGRDPGAVYGRRGKRDYMVEHEVVYDIAERLVRLLDAKGYETYRTVEDPHRRYPKQKLTANGLGRERVLVTPPYRMDSAKIAVNMRVFLVNALYRRLVRRDGVDPQHIVLLSIHGDALAKTLRGAMVYYPDHRLRRREFRPRGNVYGRRQEAVPRFIRFQPAANKSAEAASRRFGELVLRGFKDNRLGVAGRRAVRSYYYRNGERTLPGLLRYSSVPTSVLVEVANLNNRKDRLAMLAANYRQRIAEALADALDYLRAERAGPAITKKAS